MSIKEFDFSRKRVYRNGRCLSKSTLMFSISELDPWSCYSIYDCYPYSDYKACLFNLLSN